MGRYPQSLWDLEHTKQTDDSSWSNRSSFSAQRKEYSYCNFLNKIFEVIQGPVFGMEMETLELKRCSL